MFSRASPKLEGLIFTNNFFIYFWQGRKLGQGVPLNCSNLEKWIEPGFVMAHMAEKSYRESASDGDICSSGVTFPPSHCKERLLPKKSSLKRTELLHAIESECNCLINHN